jgi:hypothetical protein
VGARADPVRDDSSRDSTPEAAAPVGLRGGDVEDTDMSVADGAEAGRAGSSAHTADVGGHPAKRQQLRGYTGSSRPRGA